MADLSHIIGLSWAAYLRTPHWGEMRAACIARDKFCRGCGETEGLQAHHVFYPPHGRWDLGKVEHLTAFCQDCHDLHTNRQHQRKILKSAPAELVDYQTASPREYATPAVAAPPAVLPDYAPASPREPRSAPAPPAPVQFADYKSPRSK